MKTFYKIKNFLQGKKTYIISVLTALYVLLQAFSLINTSPEQDIAVYGLLGALFATTIGAKIDRK